MFMSPSDKRKLRQHAIFLDDAKLSDALGVDPKEQIESILGYEIPLFIDQQRAEESDATVPVMIWAHGGNVMRYAARHEALRHIDTWLNNGIYPIYVLWDTGPAATAGDALKELETPDAADEERRAQIHEIFQQSTWDNVFDAVADVAEARDIWREMIQAARDSNTGTGGGNIFVNLLANKDGLKRDIELHAVGHSAGAIFHAYFTPLLLEKGFDVKTLQLLAPAIRVDAYTTFLEKLKALEKNGKTIGNKVMFTMDKKHELADKLLHIYRSGSLLYFIRDNLDTVWNPAILGLDECFEAAVDDVRNSFGQVTLTPTDGAALGQQSGATTHTAFSSDPATLNSVAYNILGTAPRYPFLGGRL